MLDDDPTPMSAASPPVVRFESQEGRAREQTVPLEWPFFYGERRVDAIVVRRMTTAQVEAYVETLKEAEEKISPPMLFFPDGVPVPSEVLDAMDSDDETTLCEAITRFLPRRLRPVSAPTPPSGVDTASQSQATSI